MKRIGILGGTFDPIHTGHIELAKDVYDLASLDKVLLVPAKISPFKQQNHLSSEEDRLEMVRLAAMTYDGLDASDVEMRSEGVSYTYLTLRTLKEELGEDTKLYFITGTDAILKIEQWMMSEELLRNYSYIIGSRPGYRQQELEECIAHLHDKYGTEIINVHNRQFDISSTEIRERLKNSESISGLVPEKVEEYILEHGLYIRTIEE